MFSFNRNQIIRMETPCKRLLPFLTRLFVTFPSAPEAVQYATQRAERKTFLAAGFYHANHVYRRNKFVGGKPQAALLSG